MYPHRVMLLELIIRSSEDVVIARQRARQISALLGLAISEQTSVATAVSEIARNAQSYAGRGEVKFSLLQQMHETTLDIYINDHGPGIPSLSKILLGQHTSEKSIGGILSAKRMMDHFDIQSSSDKGTSISMSLILPKHLSVISAQQIAHIVDQLAKYRANNTSDEIHQQNHELLHALELLNQARKELEQRVEERTAQLHATNLALQQQMVERRQAEAELHQHQQLLAQAARISSMGEIGSAIAHELNQPLTAILTFTQGCIRRLEAHEGMQQILKNLLVVTEQASRAGEIIHRLKDFARKGETKCEIHSIDKIIDSVATLITYEIQDKPITLQFQLALELPSIMVDKIQIEQVLVNLLRNSIEAMQEAHTPIPTIIICTQLLANHQIEIAVRDNGPGFAPEIASKLLDPYFTTKPHGMGMGLSISRTIIENHGGFLTAINDKNGGGLFRFTLPTVKEEALYEL
jgi:C4-dicarboxylate-specific signal transduction histidine kinase